MKTSASKENIQQEALNRAVSNNSIANYQAIIEGFMDKGINEMKPSPDLARLLTYRKKLP
ncbi:hypothetical protein [Erwinia tasmaniensis]|uniref:hypothetical protein n=1 Tax=Erwinia tasmaniensis TaxID=338565 RepID=UPI0002D64CDE|nr:hypothetical protein [Erwinia tasmaniensis]